MIGAVVQVLIAEQTTPALLADAFPWFVASSMHATRVRFAFVAELSLPSCLTTVKRETCAFIS